MILLDTDFASVLAKADIVELVIKLFCKNDLLDIIKKIEETDKRIIDLKLVFD
jgi:hypothetical protein